MKRMFINLLVYLLISSYQLKSQTLYSVDKWMEYIEEMASETEDEAISSVSEASLLISLIVSSLLTISSIVSGLLWNSLLETLI